MLLMDGPRTDLLDRHLDSNKLPAACQVLSNLPKILVKSSLNCHPERNEGAASRLHQSPGLPVGAGKFFEISMRRPHHSLPARPHRAFVQILAAPGSKKDRYCRTSRTRS